MSWPAPGFSKGSAVLAQIGRVAGLLPDAKSIGDEGVELVALFIPLSGIDEAQVDRGVAAVGDDGEQDIVARLRRAVAFLDRLDALVEQALIGLEGGRRLGRDDLPLAAGDRRHLDVVAADRRATRRPRRSGTSRSVRGR